MSEPSRKNLVASVRRRLYNRARDTDRPFNELLQYFAMERFLYRLSQSPHAGKFVLKGALMLVVWEDSLSRPTLDIDLLGRVSNCVDDIVALVKQVCTVEVEADGLAFDPRTVNGTNIAEDADYEGVRVRFRGSLGSARIFMQLDVGFGDVVSPQPKLFDYPTILDFPAPRLLGYHRETAIAEADRTDITSGVAYVNALRSRPRASSPDYSQTKRIGR